MIGAIVGDIVGSIYEGRPIKTTDFPLFHPHCHPTDDTVLTVALADSILNGTDYVRCLKEYFARYPHVGYGGSFVRWAMSISTSPYNSWGNGSAMRVNPVGFAYESLEDVLERAKQSAEVTHNHPEGVKGAQATAAVVFLARKGKSKAEIKAYIEQTFAYDLSQTLDDIRPTYQFDVSCQGTVPPAITALLESNDFEDAIRKAVSLGGDSDTLACITGGMAHALYGGVPAHIKAKAFSLLDRHLAAVTREFTERYQCG
jgi:ADP-ribosylglycohydrolase